ncbi:2,3-bisphosphoglycerate-independent phosphoglycerate mutase [bacterium]|nr:MAG: 2,3-bisphosphoglycerate-independent phosphoglycerate mutase [bacterium]
MTENKKKKPVVLMILDGWGIAPPGEGNAIYLANTPVMDKLWEEFPHAKVKAYGEVVGLQENKTSGSETAHENIGAGRVVIQDSRYITESIEDGSFFNNTVLLGAIKNLNKNKNSALHLMGLLSSDDSSHSRQKHLKALLEFAKKNRVKKVYLHLFTDGRDAPPRSAKQFLRKLSDTIQEIGVGEIATIGGRFYGMDRSKNWDRLMISYNAMVLGKGATAKNAFDAVDQAYEKGVTDEYIIPTVIVDDHKHPVATIKDNDSVIFFHLRSDRARQFTKLFVLDSIEEAKGVKRKKILKNLFFVAFTNFGPDLPIRTAFATSPIKNTLPFVLGGLKQLYIAETEKFAHVTYFFNGGYANPIGSEARIVIQSKDVTSYKDSPEMSSKEISEVIVGNIKFDVYDFIAGNLANLDMVGHTGDIKAAIKSAEYVDHVVDQIVQSVLEKDGTAIVVGDHGNADEMLDINTGEIMTSHSKNPVPFIIINNLWQGKNKILKDVKLCDVAPTVIDLFGLEQPIEMTGDSVLKDELTLK